MADSVERTIRRDRAWQAWVGSTADLERVGRLVGKLLDRRRELAVAAWEQENPRPEDPEKDEVLSMKYIPYPTYAALAADKIHSIDVACSLDVSTTDRNGDTSSGGLESVLAEFDSRDYNMIVLRAQFFTDYKFEKEELELAFVRDASTAGVTLRIASTEQGWAKQALAEITEEVDKGRKWWGFLRTDNGSLLMALVTFGLFALLSSLLLTLTDWPRNKELAVGFFASSIPTLVALSGQIRKNWLFPAVEVVSDGVTPRGLRVVLSIAGLLVTSVVGVAINTIK